VLLNSNARPAKPLPARLDGLARLVLDNAALLRDMVDHYGSPVNIILPRRFQENIAAFELVLAEAGVAGQVCFPQKVSQSSALLEVASTTTTACESSSLQELQAAMAAGIPGWNILASGPAKADDFMYAAARARATIVLDSEEEIVRLVTLLKQQALPLTSIFLRMAGFMITTQGRNEPIDEERLDLSRFGMTSDALERVISIIESERSQRHVKLRGVHFHLDNHSITDRVRAMEKAFSFIDGLEKRGLYIRYLDIGGGFTASYVDTTDFAEFLLDYKARLRRREPMMFRSKFFGLDGSAADESRRGNFYPHDLSVGGPPALDALLSSQGTNERTMAAALRRRNLRLLVEPGKALLDHVGLVVLEVSGSKTAPDGSVLIQCEGNVTHFWEQWIGSEFTVDPIFLPTRFSAEGGPAVGYLSGNLCLESDMLSWRPLAFSQFPCRGDLLVFLNTAGYQSTFVDVTTHRRQPPARIVIYESGSGLRWTSDDRFSPLLMRKGP